jgi:hypothetical protein
MAALKKSLGQAAEEKKQAPAKKKAAGSSPLKPRPSARGPEHLPPLPRNGRGSAVPLVHADDAIDLTLHNHVPDFVIT